MASAKTTLLCAVRFWGGAGFPGRATTTQTLRRGVRHVARKQGLTPSEMDAAERSLVKAGLVQRGGKHSGASIGLTERGIKVSSRACKAVTLAPWDHKATFPFMGSKKRRKRR